MCVCVYVSISSFVNKVPLSNAVLPPLLPTPQLTQLLIAISSSISPLSFGSVQNTLATLDPLLSAAQLLSRHRSSQPLTCKTTELILNAYCYHLLSKLSTCVLCAFATHSTYTHILFGCQLVSNPQSSPWNFPFSLIQSPRNPPSLFSPLSDSTKTLAALVARRHLSAVVYPIIKHSFVSLSRNVQPSIYICRLHYVCAA